MLKNDDLARIQQLQDNGNTANFGYHREVEMHADMSESESFKNKFALSLYLLAR